MFRFRTRVIAFLGPLNRFRVIVIVWVIPKDRFSA